MSQHYDQTSVGWDLAKIKEQIAGLENWDILFDGKIIGAIRLAYDDEGCYLRDLQVGEEYQNKGIGAVALGACEQFAINSGAGHLRLRVLKISPAFNLYKRHGFNVSKQDDKFYYMEKVIS